MIIHLPSPKACSIHCPLSQVRVNSINNMSENKTEVKARIVSAEDGSIKVVVFSAPNLPPLLGAKAVRVRVSQIANLLPTRSPFSLADRRAAPRTHPLRTSPWPSPARRSRSFRLS